MPLELHPAALPKRRDDQGAEAFVISGLRSPNSRRRFGQVCAGLSETRETSLGSFKLPKPPIESF
jgi:hypothetical protein